MLPPVWYEIIGVPAGPSAWRRTPPPACRRDGIQLLELASEAHQLFLEQKPEEKRRLLGFLVATASWKDGELSASLRPPFDLIREGVVAAAAQTAAAIDGERSRTDRAPALSNSHQRRFSNSKAAVAIHSQGKMNRPGFDGGCILWEGVAHVSIEAADAEARIGTSTSS
jgi:hypothetical protein